MLLKNRFKLLWIYRESFMPLMAVGGNILIFVILSSLLGKNKLRRLTFEPLECLTSGTNIEQIYNLYAVGFWWLLSVYLFWLIAIINIIVCWYIVNRSLATYSEVQQRRINIILTFILPIITILLIVIVMNVTTLVPSQDLIKHVDKIFVDGRRLLEATQGMMIVSVIFVILASTIVLVPSRNHKHVIEQTKLVNILLYSSAIVMFFWIIEARLMYGFAATLIVPEEGMHVDRIAPIISLVVGLAISTLLVSMYSSSILVLHRRHKDIKDVSTETSEGDTKAEFAENQSPLKIFVNTWPRIFALLGPALPGILEALFGFKLF